MKAILRRGWDKTGFTLVEVLVSLIFVSLVLMGIFKLERYSLDMCSEARFLTIAEQLACARMAVIKSSSVLGEGDLSGDFGDDFPDYTYTEQIEKISEEDGLYKVKLLIEDQTLKKSFFVTIWLYRRPSMDSHS